MNLAGRHEGHRPGPEPMLSFIREQQSLSFLDYPHVVSGVGVRPDLLASLQTPQRDPAVIAGGEGHFRRLLAAE
jgi:hypothetical protein